MAKDSGVWFMRGSNVNDPDCLHTVEEAIEYIETIGFLPLFRNDSNGISDSLWKKEHFPMIGGRETKKKIPGNGERLLPAAIEWPMVNSLTRKQDSSPGSGSPNYSGYDKEYNQAQRRGR